LGCLFATKTLEEQPHCLCHAKIEFLIEQLRIMQRLVYEEEPYRGEDIGGHPHAAKRRQDVLFGKLLTEIVQEEEDNEKDHGEDQRHADPSFADDGAQGRSDEEHHQAGDGEGQLLMPGNAMDHQLVLLVAIQESRLVQLDLDGA